MESVGLRSEGMEQVGEVMDESGVEAGKGAKHALAKKQGAGALGNRGNGWKNLHMSGEAFEILPGDWFSGEWWAMPTPVGKRVIIVASQGTTVARTRSGKIWKCFPSGLPGGARRNGSGTVVLDVVWEESTRSFYVLDGLLWNSMMLMDMPTDVRWSLVTSKLTEDVPQVMSQSSSNPFPIIPLTTLAAPVTEELISTITSSPVSLPGGIPGAGVAFYHRLAFYQSGTTPLVAFAPSAQLPLLPSLPIATSPSTGPEMSVEPSLITFHGGKDSLVAALEEVANSKSVVSGSRVE